MGDGTPERGITRKKALGWLLGLGGLAVGGGIYKELTESNKRAALEAFIKKLDEQEALDRIELAKDGSYSPKVVRNLVISEDNVAFRTKKTPNERLDSGNYAIRRFKNGDTLERALVVEGDHPDIPGAKAVWYQTYDENGDIGYVCSKYATKRDPLTPKPK